MTTKDTIRHIIPQYRLKSGGQMTSQAVIYTEYGHMTSTSQTLGTMHMIIQLGPARLDQLPDLQYLAKIRALIESVLLGILYAVRMRFLRYHYNHYG